MDFIFGFNLTNVLLTTIVVELLWGTFGLGKRLSYLEGLLVEKGLIEHKDIKKNKHK